jgi:cobalt-zinc-cadmium efflux system protein
MSTTETALTAHLVLPGDSHYPELLTEVRSQLRRRFDIEHATLQLELRATPESCRLGARC